jgi:hypothetical protein
LRSRGSGCQNRGNGGKFGAVVAEIAAAAKGNRLREKNSLHHAILRGCHALNKRHQMSQVFSSAAPFTFLERLARVNFILGKVLHKPP